MVFLLWEACTRHHYPEDRGARTRPPDRLRQPSSCDPAVCTGWGAGAVKTPHTPHIRTTPQPHNTHTLHHTYYAAPHSHDIHPTHTYTHTTPHTYYTTYTPYTPCTQTHTHHTHHTRCRHITYARAHSIHTSIPTPGSATCRASAPDTAPSSLQSPGQPHSLTFKPEVSARGGSRTQPGCRGPRRGPPIGTRVAHPSSVLKLPQGANFPPAQRTPDTPGAKTAIS